MTGETTTETADQIEIGQLTQRYGLALDEKNYDLLDSVFTPDALLHYVMDDRETKATFRDWKDIFRQFLVPFYWTSHSITTPLIELANDGARSSCRLIANHVQIRLDGERNLWTVYGFYQDRLVKGDGGWRILERYFRGVHSEGQLLPAAEVEPFPNLPWNR